jgi:hypothetical protein
MAGLTFRNAEEDILDVVFGGGDYCGFGAALLVGDVCDDSDWGGLLVGGVSD